MAREPDFDEAWYLKQNPDVAEGIARGEIESARHHYLTHGYEEGRPGCPADVVE